jgi:hypothetical protein
LIVRQVFRHLQSFPILAFDEKHICPGSGGLELLLGAHWHRFHRLKCFLCNAEVTVLRDGQLALNLQRSQGGGIKCQSAINRRVSLIEIPQHLVVEGEILQRPDVLRI